MARNTFAPALCGYYGNIKKGSYQGHLFIEEKDMQGKKEKKKMKIYMCFYGYEKFSSCKVQTQAKVSYTIKLTKNKLCLKDNE